MFPRFHDEQRETERGAEPFDRFCIRGKALRGRGLFMMSDIACKRLLRMPKRAGRLMYEETGFGNSATGYGHGTLNFLLGFCGCKRDRLRSVRKFENRGVFL